LLIDNKRIVFDIIDITRGTETRSGRGNLSSGTVNRDFSSVRWDTKRHGPSHFNGIWNSKFNTIGNSRS